MKNIVIANGIYLAPYAFQPLVEGGNTLDRVYQYARSLPDVDQVYLLLPDGADAVDGFTVKRQPEWSLPGLLKMIRQLSEGCDHIFYFYADCPFLDHELTENMYENHRRYFANYTFADGFPYGLSPEIFQPGIISALQSLSQKDSATGTGCMGISRDSLFELIKKDINSFDIETEISSVDLRLLRLNLCADSKRNFLLLQKIVLNKCLSAETICRLIQEKPEILRNLPSFFSIQIVEGCPQLCSYCPYPVFGIRDTGKQGEMPFDRYESLLDSIEGYCEDAVISISLWGEPAYHERIYDLILNTVERKHLSLVVETSGVGWKEEDLRQLADQVRKAPDWIISLDSNDEEVYSLLRGNGRTEAVNTIELIHRLFPGHAYAQAVRMKENEENLEEFFRYWKKQTSQVIVQKYDSYCGYLPDRKVTDLSPLKRFPCWHVKRDVCILLDGTVPLCREDLTVNHGLGNLFEDELSTIWEKGQSYYLQHIEGKYPELCRNCDEYYTFNF